MTTDTPDKKDPQDQSEAPENQASELKVPPTGGEEDKLRTALRSFFKLFERQPSSGGGDSTGGGVPTGGGGQAELLDDPSRRTFFKRAAIGGGIALAGGGLTYAGAKVAISGRSVDDMDEAIKTEGTLKPMDQRNVILTFATSKTLNEKHPERNEQYSKLQNKKFHFYEGASHFEHRVPWDNSKPGYTQLDKALHHAAWNPLKSAETWTMAHSQPNTRVLGWDQSDVEKEKYEFKSERDAAWAIKSAARVWGAVRCGITRRDRRWDYDPLYDIEKSRTLTWERDFPFEPKTVIVMAMPMDYDAMATAPFWTAEAAIGHGYVVMAQIANQMAKFLRGLGYQAVGAGNDLGMSVAYGVAAGIGEAGRHSQLMVPGIGPRVRLCKVYTDFEFVEYDKPHDWGMAKFCLSCGECAKACPSNALPKVEDPGSGWGYQPQYEFSDEPGYTWNNHTGVLKFHSDAKKCFDFWLENDSACGNCVTACTYNEPDYWHHWLSMASTTVAPGFLHTLMSHMHPMFGYGATGDPSKVKKFWETGKGMRVNSSMKNNIATAGRS